MSTDAAEDIIRLINSVMRQREIAAADAQAIVEEFVVWRMGWITSQEGAWIEARKGEA